MAKIEAWQAKVVHGQLGTSLRYLGHLRDRLKANGFADEDQLLAATLRAYDALFTLSTKMHSVACGGIFAIDALKAPPMKDDSGDTAAPRPNQSLPE